MKIENPFISNLKKPVCAYKHDFTVLQIGTLFPHIVSPLNSFLSLNSFLI